MAKTVPSTLNVLFSTFGPVADDMREKAEEAVELARENLDKILLLGRGNMPLAMIDEIARAIDYDIIVEGDIIELVIGIRDEGKITRQMADKDSREDKIIGPAVREVFG